VGHHPSAIMQAHLNRTIRCGHHGTLIEVRGDGTAYDTFTMDCEPRCPDHELSQKCGRSNQLKENKK